MQSLTDLNNWGNEVVTYTDNRPATVKFNIVAPLSPDNVYKTFTTTNNVIDPSIEIIDIINADTANVRYRVSIKTGGSNPLTGSSISWDSLPSGVTLTSASGVYTLSGIKTVEQWNQIKSFNWILPSNYSSFPFWYVDVAVLYFNQQLNEERVVDWDVIDERFYWFSALESQFTQVANNLRVRFGKSVTQPKISSLYCNAYVYEGIIQTLPITTSLYCEPIEYANTAIFTMTTKTRYNAIGKSNLNSLTTINLPELHKVMGNLISRTYRKNNINYLFASSTPYIDDVGSSTNSSYTITLSSSLGQFSDNPDTWTPVSTYTFTGTKLQVNLKFSQIIFFPIKDLSSNGFITFNLSRDGTTLINQSIALTGQEAVFDPVIYTITSSSSWIPKYREWYYGGIMDYLIVAGGASGGNGSTYEVLGFGGGGGGVIEVLNQSFDYQSYPAVVGLGGQQGSGVLGLPGGDSSFRNQIAYGGRSGYINPFPGAGGSSGAPTTHPGGANSTDSIGSGGGGAGGPGFPAAPGKGGIGYLSSITGLYYGGGGGSGRASGGQGGGGSGGYASSGSYAFGNNGSVNTGGGGGGADVRIPVSGFIAGGKGGSGVVIIRVHE